MVTAIPQAAQTIGGALLAVWAVSVLFKTCKKEKMLLRAFMGVVDVTDLPKCNLRCLKLRFQGNISDSMVEGWTKDFSGLWTSS